MGSEDDVLQWAGVQISCTATNGSSITVNMAQRENKLAVWGKVAGCLSKEPAVFRQSVPLNRRITDKIHLVIDQENEVTDEERELLLRPWVL